MPEECLNSEHNGNIVIACKPYLLIAILSSVCRTNNILWKDLIKVVNY